MNARLPIAERVHAKSVASERQLSFVGVVLLRAVVVVASFIATGPTDLIAQEALVQEIIDPAREASVKAVFLYSYGRYVTWPEEESGKIEDDFVIGVLGDSPVIDKLERIAKKRTIAGHPIRLIRVETPEKIPRCHILYVAGQADENLQKAIVAATADRPLLIVGETDGFAERGASINFYLSGNSVRFQINAETVHQRGLQLNAQLLNLGDRVGGPPED